MSPEVWISILFILLAIGMTCVKIGSVALRMTGLDQDTASFQALSAFSGTGFTTREAELITKDRRRRAIARGLMIAGNVGFAVTIAAILQTFNVYHGSGDGSLIRRVLIDLSIVVVAIFVIYNLAWGRWVNQRLNRLIEHRLERVTDLSMPHFEQMLKIGEGYGISEIRIREDHPAIGHSLVELGWSTKHVLILAIQRGNDLIKSPSATEIIQAGDNLTCYGPAGEIRMLASPEELTKSGRFPKATAPSA